MKWEPIAAMVILFLLGFWIVWGPTVKQDLRPDAKTQEFSFAGSKGELEAVMEPDGDYSFRLLFRGDAGNAAGAGDTSASETAVASPRVFTKAEFISIFGQARYDKAVKNAGNKAFRLLNISSAAGIIWVIIGFAGQAAFFGRMFIQWLTSERRKESVIPEVFWWLSLIGGIMSFAYWGWRQDLIGVLGQTSGVVIYARNIRLIHKRKRRQERAATVG